MQVYLQIRLHHHSLILPEVLWDQNSDQSLDTLLPSPYRIWRTGRYHSTLW